MVRESRGPALDEVLQAHEAVGPPSSLTPNAVQVAAPKSCRGKVDRGPARLLFEVKSNPAVRFDRSFKDDALAGNPFDHAVRFLHRFEGKGPTGAWLQAGFLARDSARCPVGDVPGNGECVKDLRWSRLDQGGESDVGRNHGRMIGTHAVP